MKPDFGERYFTYSREYEVIEMIWTDDFYDNLFLKQGLVFKECSEAFKKRSEIFKEIMGYSIDKDS